VRRGHTSVRTWRAQAVSYVCPGSQMVRCWMDGCKVVAQARGSPSRASELTEGWLMHHDGRPAVPCTCSTFALRA